jgi:type II restriction enzyme
MLPPRVKTAADLVTSRKATTQGFIAQAHAKVILANPHIEDALRLDRVLQAVNNPEDLVDKAEVRTLLVAAVGLSEKAVGHLSPQEQTRIVREGLREVHNYAGQHWKQQVLLRFALTRGDSLGGTSRNLAGANAKDQFADAVLHALRSKGWNCSVEYATRGTRKVRSVSWNERAMVFDRKPRIAGKNIDVIVLQTASSKSVQELLEDKNAYVACGEVKGGIDPAGADEHWKTAHSALERIRMTFGLQTPALFFAGAAIETSMAREIVAQLRSNRLTYAANLTKPQQARDLANWLVSL